MLSLSNILSAHLTLHGIHLFCLQALITAWDSDQRVKALKIAIQVCVGKTNYKMND